MNFVTMMALGFPMQLFFEILGQPYFPFFLVFCESLALSLQALLARAVRKQPSISIHMTDLVVQCLCPQGSLSTSRWLSWISRIWIPFTATVSFTSHSSQQECLEADLRLRNCDQASRSPYGTTWMRRNTCSLPRNRTWFKTLLSTLRESLDISSMCD